MQDYLDEDDHLATAVPDHAIQCATTAVHVNTTRVRAALAAVQIRTGTAQVTAHVDAGRIADEA
jgi:hypothetical protein